MIRFDYPRHLEITIISLVSPLIGLSVSMFLGSSAVVLSVIINSRQAEVNFHPSDITDPPPGQMQWYTRAYDRHAGVTREEEETRDHVLYLECWREYF